jgi:hypothetical protein
MSRTSKDKRRTVVTWTSWVSASPPVVTKTILRNLPPNTNHGRPSIGRRPYTIETRCGRKRCAQKEPITLETVKVSRTEWCAEFPQTPHCLNSDRRLHHVLVNLASRLGPVNLIMDLVLVDLFSNLRVAAQVAALPSQGDKYEIINAWSCRRPRRRICAVLDCTMKPTEVRNNWRGNRTARMGCSRQAFHADRLHCEASELQIRQDVSPHRTVRARRNNREKTDRCEPKGKPRRGCTN